MSRMFCGTNGRRTARGFTLIELLVTIAVIAIMVTMGVPLYGQFTAGSLMTSRTSELVSAVHYARSEAVSRRETIRMEGLGGDWNDGWQVSVVSSGDVLRIVDLHSNNVGVQIGEANALTQFDFDGQGRATADVTFNICPDAGGADAGRDLQVNRFGRVQLTQVDC